MMRLPYFLFPTLSGYDVRRQLLRDIFAGIAVAGLAIPQAMSNASLAGLPPQYGLYGVIQIGYPLLGQSPVLVVGPIALTALLTSGTFRESGISPFTTEWIVACAVLSLVVGIYQLIFAFLGLGKQLVTVLSEATTKAFTASGVFTLIISQLRDLTGSKTLVDFLNHPNFDTLMVSVASMIIMEISRLHTSRSGPLLVIVFGCAFQYLVYSTNVKAVGLIPGGLPHSIPVLSVWTVLSGTHVKQALLWAIPIAFISFTECFVIAKAKLRNGSIDADRELAAVGLANLWTSLFGSYPVTGSFSRTAVNIESGSSSGVSYFGGFGLVVVILYTATSWLSLLPRACIASIVLSATMRLVDTKYVIDLYRSKHWDKMFAYVLIFMLSMRFGVEIGLFVGILLDAAQMGSAFFGTKTQSRISKRILLTEGGNVINQLCPTGSSLPCNKSELDSSGTSDLALSFSLMFAASLHICG